jgi:glycosyltransferase involved in cell wall biosynthesis
VASAVAPFAPLPGVRDVVYVGNMGLSMALEVVIDAAALLRDDPTVRFVMIGGGSAAASLRARAAEQRLTNVLFTGPLPRADAARALDDAAATVVPLVASITDTLPTKLFDAMIAGTPIVLSASGEAKRVVELADAGLVVTPEDPAALAAGVRSILADPALQARCRANGPPFVRANYDRAAVMRDFVARVHAVRRR